MDQDAPKHEKIRFRRDEIAPLTAFPSSEQPALSVRRPRKRRRALVRAVLGIATVMILVAAALAGGVYAIGRSGIGMEKVRGEAEALISTLAGEPIDVRFGPAGISVDASRFIGLEMQGLTLAAKDNGAELVDAGLIRFGVRFVPLLSGQFKIGSARIADARIVPSAVNLKREGPDWSAGLRRPDGLLDPDLVLTAAFRSVHRAFDALDLRQTESVELENIELVLGSSGGRLDTITIVEASMARAGAGQLTMSGEIRAAGETLRLTGSAVRAAGERRIEQLAVKAEAGSVSDPGGTLPSGTLSITGSEAPGNAGGALSVSVDAKRLTLDLKDGDAISGAIALDATLRRGADKIEISRATFSAGRSALRFHGAVGPTPEAEAGDAPTYRYELVSDGSELAPDGSTEPALDLLARLAGHYDPTARRLSADAIGMRTGPGEVTGTGSVTFAANGSPAIALSLSVPTMPVGQAKQIWPFFAAKGARNWVLANVFGGTVRDSRIDLNLAAGRIGNGKPLSGEEVSGHFVMEGARFDVAGRMPPVRDANGEVDFAGADVTIKLSSGTVYMPNGKTVDARDGTFLIGSATADPHIGALDIQVAGDASAVTELASYEPINALRQLDLAPADFSGAVEGRVKADIPLRKNIPMARLSWLVDMKFSDLAVAKPFQGQMVTEAAGTIRIVPTSVDIDAKAKLNGIPATLAIVEPLAGSEVERERDIALELDDATRAKLMPGLADLLSGPVTVKVEDAGAAGAQSITADLTKATLSLPWVGWSKGAGVAADVAFDLTMKGRDLSLDRFKLSGAGFSASGDLDVTGGALARARFSDVRLNKGDSVAVDVTRKGRGYDVSVKGDAMDARAIVKRYLSADGGAGGAGAAGDSTPVTLSASVGTLNGFSGEALRNVAIDYRGAGARVDGLTISATARSGGSISITNSSSGGARQVGMRSADAGAILRFLDIYKHMEGGSIDMALAAKGKGPLRGKIDARDFSVVDEPRLASLVSSAPAEGGRSLDTATRGKIDTSRAQFERGFTLIEKGDGYLNLESGVLRGPQIGASFQGTLFDAKDNMAITGTFMPIYGLNRLFGELPLIGQILGNGRDRGLIGITFKLAGDVKSPQLQVNPLSVIAPGIFRSIFEFQ